MTKPCFQDCDADLKRVRRALTAHVMLLRQRRL